MTKIFVIAGNLAEAKDWIRKDIEARTSRGESITLSHYIYVDSTTRVKGYLNPSGVFVGTWRSRRDIKEIVDLLILASPQRNPKLHLIREELRIGSPRPTPKRFVGKGLNQPQAIEQAANDLAKHIDQHLLDEFTRRINGGILSKSSAAIKDIYSD